MGSTQTFPSCPSIRLSLGTDLPPPLPFCTPRARCFHRIRRSSPTLGQVAVALPPSQAPTSFWCHSRLCSSWASPFPQPLRGFPPLSRPQDNSIPLNPFKAVRFFSLFPRLSPGTRRDTALGVLPSLGSCTWPDPPAGPQSGAGLVAAGRRAGVLGVGWGGRILHCPQPAHHRPRPAPPFSGLWAVFGRRSDPHLCVPLLWWRAQCLLSGLAETEPVNYPVSPYSSLPTPPSTGASLEGLWQERGTKVDSRQTPPSFPDSGLKKGKGGSGRRGLVAKAATCPFFLPTLQHGN